MKKLTLEEFVSRARCLLGDNYDFTKTTYLNSKIKTIITCKTHGDFLVTPSNVLEHNSGCPECSKEKISKNKTMSLREFLRRAVRTHGLRYDYSLVEYINSHSKIKIICRKHGEFEQEPSNHLNGHGCPKCKNLKLSPDQT